MAADPVAFRTKFRKMAADPFAFYRGSACLFYADVAELEDPWADERTRRVWIQGDLHAENFSTYLNAQGVLIFDVNDFDEAYLGPFTWDLQRFAASMALLGWGKALSDADIDGLVEAYLRAYLDQVQFLDVDDDSDFSLRWEPHTAPWRSPVCAPPGRFLPTWRHIGVRQPAESPLCLHVGAAEGRGSPRVEGADDVFDGRFDHEQVPHSHSGGHRGDQLRCAGQLSGEGQMLAQPLRLDRDVEHAW